MADRKQTNKVSRIVRPNRLSARELAQLSGAKKFLKKDLVIEKAKPALRPGTFRIPPSVSKPAEPELPDAPSTNPFDNLPYPSPGDRIQAEHFKILSQSLDLIQQASLLASAVFGKPFAIVKSVLAAEGYSIASVFSVHGQELVNEQDTSLDDRVVLQVRPVELGEPEVIVVLSEVVEQRRVMPNLIGMTHAGAQNAVRQALGPAASGPPVQTPNLIGQPLSALGK